MTTTDQRDALLTEMSKLMRFRNDLINASEGLQQELVDTKSKIEDVDKRLRLLTNVLNDHLINDTDIVLAKLQANHDA